MRHCGAGANDPVQCCGGREGEMPCLHSSLNVLNQRSLCDDPKWFGTINDSAQHRRGFEFLGVSGKQFNRDQKDQNGRVFTGGNSFMELKFSKCQPPGVVLLLVACRCSITEQFPG